MRMKSALRNQKSLKSRLRGALSPSIAIATAICALGGAAHAQTAADVPVDDTAAVKNDVIIVTGTRVTGMTIEDSPAPIQVVTAEVLKSSGATDLINALANQTPSFNANQTGGDMASQTLTASMRALSPNH